ncbi:hypothetical protein ED733_003032 [Metarhizium rileyi]|uniref:Ethyl tert-butyl ether degradation EthD n=1 Tax=Metarhizium rileyi (strain RCEF 4871) TaxID=1649241 RepID=A0A5C6G3C6_METRR|nr:hypothetical protein ED733_003032 [Metarhizium rileyi]
MIMIETGPNKLDFPAEDFRPNSSRLRKSLSEFYTTALPTNALQKHAESMASITILYPSGHEFDLEYYMQTHMPLVSSCWKEEGLQSWEIVQFASDQPYQVQATLKFASLAAWEAASTGKNSANVFGDIPTFTTAEPVVLKGLCQGSETVA